MTKLLALSGSLRAASTNTLLINEAARMFDADTFETGDLNLPLYNGDVEENDGIPAAVQTLSDQIAAADAVVISTPEYNKSLSGVLKNALDWVSRTKDNPWLNKPVAIMSATAGRAGGEQAQAALTLCLAPFRPQLVMGPQVLVASSFEQFDDNGKLKGEMYQDLLGDLMDRLKARI